MNFISCPNSCFKNSPCLSLKENYTPLNKIGIFTGALFFTLGSLALAGLLFPHSPLGIFLISLAHPTGIHALVFCSFFTGLILIAKNSLSYNHNENPNNNPSTEKAKEPKLINPPSLPNSEIDSSPTSLEDEADTQPKNASSQEINGIKDRVEEPPLKLYAYGKVEEPNKACRPSMEDTTIAVDFELNGQTVTAFGVYDGHGGKDVSELIKISFKDALETELKKLENLDDISTALKNTYSWIHNVAKTCIENDKVGSCALSAVIIGDNLWVANAGDSRAVLFDADKKHGEEIALSTVDHSAKTNQEECNRILSLKVGIYGGRVAGVLIPTRAIGDRILDGLGVLCEPEIYHWNLKEIKKGGLILACDGVWDVIDNQLAVDLVKRHIENPIQAAYQLTEAALNGKSTDNISVIVVDLTKKV